MSQKFQNTDQQRVKGATSAEELFAAALSHHKAGRLAEAEHLYKRLLALNPKHVEALNQIGLLAIEGKAPARAVDYISQALKQRRHDPTVLTNYATALMANGEAEKGYRSAKKAVKFAPESAQANCALARALRSLARSEDAIPYFEKALEIQPGFGQALLGLARAYGELGDYEAAVIAYRKLIALKPEAPAPYIGLAQAKRFTEDDAETKVLLELCRNASLNISQKIELHYAAGKVLDDLGRYDEAFGHFKAANEFTRSDFDITAHEDWLSALISLIDREFFAARTDYGDPSPQPIFIVGMPRSGTSLVEQILAAHPDVYGAGELESLHQVVLQALSGVPGEADVEKMTALGRQQIAEMARAYMKDLTKNAGAATRVTDKLPHNFERLHFVALMFPNAKVIHCRRDPIDTCLSCYTKNFRGSHGYNTDLQNLALHYRQYERLMAHWRDVLPLKVFDVDYEAIVEDTEAESRRLVAHVGLDWDVACLSFNEAQRAVRTPSGWQVRQPIYATAVARWRRYEQHLGPLLEVFQR